MAQCGLHVQVLTISSIIEFLRLFPYKCVVFISTHFRLCSFLERSQQSQNLMVRDQPPEEKFNAKYMKNGNNDLKEIIFMI